MAELKMAAAKQVSKQNAPSQEEIAKLAYEIYIKRGGMDGEDVKDWLEAEQLLLAKLNGKKRS